MDGLGFSKGGQTMASL